MSTKVTGDISEASIITELLCRGYSVAIPFGDNDPYDLVVDANGRLFRVQVKTGWLEDSCIRFKTCSKTTANGEPRSRDYTSDEMDAYAVRCQDTGGYFWIPVNAAGTKSTYLRVETAEIDHPSINYAEQFTFDTNLPPRCAPTD